MAGGVVGLSYLLLQPLVARVAVRRMSARRAI
jgi:hypothetical protein